MVDAGLRREHRQFGVELANRVVSQIQMDGVSAEEATSRSANEVEFRANALSAQGVPREEVRLWLQEVKAAFGERLYERLVEWSRCREVSGPGTLPARSPLR